MGGLRRRGRPWGRWLTEDTGGAASSQFRQFSLDGPAHIPGADRREGGLPAGYRLRRATRAAQNAADESEFLREVPCEGHIARCARARPLPNAGHIFVEFLG